METLLNSSDCLLTKANRKARKHTHRHDVCFRIKNGGQKRLIINFPISFWGLVGEKEDQIILRL